MTISEEILNRLQLIESEILEFYNSGTSWTGSATKLIKEKIRELGHEKEYFVNTNGDQLADDGEWLFDITFSKLKYKGHKTTTTDIPMVLESELSDLSFKGFKRDFDKLLIATNSERIFITRNINENVLKEMIEYAQESVNDYNAFKIGEGVNIIVWQECKDKTFELFKVLKEGF